MINPSKNGGSSSTSEGGVDTTKRLMSSPKCRSVEVINNPARPGSNHREVNYINYNNNNNNNNDDDLKRALRYKIIKED